MKLSWLVAELGLIKLSSVVLFLKNNFCIQGYYSSFVAMDDTVEAGGIWMIILL